MLNAYFQALAARDRLCIARDNVRIATEVFEMIKLQFNVGTATGMDVDQQQALLADQRASIPALEQNLRQTENLLALLICRAPEDVNIRGGSLAALFIPAISPGLPWEVLLRRPDVAEAEARLASQEFSVLQVRAAFFPVDHAHRPLRIAKRASEKPAAARGGCMSTRVRTDATPIRRLCLVRTIRVAKRQA